jgi:hypothetical protein
VGAKMIVGTSVFSNACAIFMMLLLSAPVWLTLSLLLLKSYGLSPADQEAARLTYIEVAEKAWAKKNSPFRRFFVTRILYRADVSFGDELFAVGRAYARFGISGLEVWNAFHYSSRGQGSSYHVPVVPFVPFRGECYDHLEWCFVGIPTERQLTNLQLFRLFTEQRLRPVAAREFLHVLMSLSDEQLREALGKQQTVQIAAIGTLARNDLTGRFSYLVLVVKKLGKSIRCSIESLPFDEGTVWDASTVLIGASIPGRRGDSGMSHGKMPIDADGRGYNLNFILGPDGGLTPLPEPPHDSSSEGYWPCGGGGG